MASKSKGYTINPDGSVTYDGTPTAAVREKAEAELIGLSRERASRADGVEDEDVRAALDAETGVVKTGEED